jgi:hypothetical protein
MMSSRMTTSRGTQNNMGNDVIVKHHHPPTSQVLACHDGIKDCRKLKSVLSCLQWHNVHTKFHENPSVVLEMFYTTDGRTNKANMIGAPHGCRERA